MIASPIVIEGPGAARPSTAAASAPAPTQFTINIELNGQPNADRKLMTVFDPLNLAVLDQKVFTGNSVSAQVPDAIKNKPASVLIYGLSGSAADHVGGSSAVARIDGATYLIDIGGSGGGGAGNAVARVLGSVEVSEQPKQRHVVALSYDGDPRQVVGQTISNLDGSYELNVSTNDDVILIALDDYGNQYGDGLALLAGDRVHPSVANGWVYECISSGALSGPEPTWSLTGAVQSIGTAQVQGKPYFEPQAHAPVKPGPL